MERAALMSRELKAQAVTTGQSVRTLGRIAAELGITCPTSLSVSELTQEYRDLFAIPGPTCMAPYEFVFRDHWILRAVQKRGSNAGETGEATKGPLLGESMIEVRKSYLQAGLQPVEELPGHIGNHLRFPARLCATEACAPPGEPPALAQNSVSGSDRARL